MKLMISRSGKTAGAQPAKTTLKHKFAVSDRVAVEFDRNEWYLGKVSKLTPSGYRVMYDYGESALVKPSVLRIVLVEAPKKIRRAMSSAEVKQINVAERLKAEKLVAEKEAAEKEAKLAEYREKTAVRDRKLALRKTEKDRQRFAEVSKPGVRVLKKWAELHGFEVTFKPDEYPHGIYLINDKKVRIVAYLYDDVKLYVLPPYVNVPKNANKDELKKLQEEQERVDAIEWGKAVLPYEKFTVKSFEAFLAEVVKKVGFRVKHLLLPASEQKHNTQTTTHNQPQTKQVKLAEKPATSPTKIKVGLKPSVSPVKPGAPIRKKITPGSIKKPTVRIKTVKK